MAGMIKASSKETRHVICVQSPFVKLVCLSVYLPLSVSVSQSIMTTYVTKMFKLILSIININKITIVSLSTSPFLFSSATFPRAFQKHQNFHPLDKSLSSILLSITFQKHETSYNWLLAKLLCVVNQSQFFFRGSSLCSNRSNQSRHSKLSQHQSKNYLSFLKSSLQYISLTNSNWNYQTRNSEIKVQIRIQIKFYDISILNRLSSKL